MLEWFSLGTNRLTAAIVDISPARFTRTMQDVSRTSLGITITQDYAAAQLEGV